MGNIPIYDRQVGTPRPSRVYTKVPAGLERKTRAKERVVGSLVDMASKVFTQVMKVAEDTQYNTAITETKKRNAIFLEGLQKQQLDEHSFEELQESYSTFKTDRREGVLDAVSMPGLKKTLGTRFDAMDVDLDINVRRLLNSKVLEDGRAKLNSDIEYYVKETRSIEDLTRRANGAAALEYIDQTDAERIIREGSTQINTSNALDDTMELSQIGGIDAATSMLLSDEAGEKYNLTYDQRVSIASRARTAWGLQNKQSIEAEKKISQESQYQAYKDIHADESILTDIDQLDNEEKYPGLTPAQKINLHKEMQSRANDGLRLEKAQRDAQMESAYSSVRIGLDDVARGVGTAKEMQGTIQDFVNQFPEYGDEIDKLTTQFAALDLKGEKKREMLYKSDLTTQLSDQYKDRTLTPAVIDQVAEQVKGYEWGGGFVEHWTMKLDQMRREIQETKDLNAWETTGQDYRNIYSDKFIQLSKGEITLEQGRTWLEENKGPGPDGVPRIGNKDFMKWWEEMDKIKDDPPHLAAAIAGIAKTYDAEIKELDDPDKIGDMVEEKENMIRKFRDDVKKNNWDAQQMSVVREIIENPIKEQTGNANARRFFQNSVIFSAFTKPPEEQMAEWAQKGWLDERGRLIGKSDEEQLKLMGINSFDELKWKGGLQREYEATGLKTADIAAEPSNQFTYLLDDQGQPLMARNQAGEMVFKVMINGEGKWMNQSELQ